MNNTDSIRTIKKKRRRGCRLGWWFTTLGVSQVKSDTRHLREGRGDQERGRPLQIGRWHFSEARERTYEAFLGWLPDEMSIPASQNPKFIEVLIWLSQHAPSRWSQ